MTDSRPLTTDQTMTEEAQGRAHWRSKLWIAALALTILVSVIVIPPLVSITRYKTRIARAMSTSLGRPVRMSGVELRLLPRPEFVITDLIVDEDPTYGAEPVLHANSVTAAIRLFTLWRGRLEINRISVDEASLNLVRTTEGRWNLDTLFRTASHSQAEGVKAGRPIPLPYLEATNSRINIKRGFEKLPYSLVNADLSFWEENPGDWRIRLKGQPARTDVSLDQADTGIVQLEGRMRRAEELRLMPMHVEMEWREAQLGQLSRLLIGSDAGWRGDVTAEMKLDGTADAANVTTRLRATGVHREEFAPVAPLDFDANCGFSYHYSARTIEKLVCDSPLGDGHLRLEGNLPSDGQPKLSLELQKIPAQAVLDALRTVRQELGAGLEADGTLSGKLTYDTTAPPVATPQVKPLHRGKKTMAKQAPAAPGPLSGSVTVDALKLSGGALGQPIQIQKVVFEPSVGTNGLGSELAGTANVPAGAPAPLVFALRLTKSGYQVTARGSGSPARVRQFAHAAGLKEAGALDAIAGEQVTLDLAIAGPWLPAPDVLPAENARVITAPAVGAASVANEPLPDRLTGTVTLHDANWKTDALPTAVQISEATLQLDGGSGVWDPVVFTYGPLIGTARLELPACDVAGEECTPKVNLAFPSLDAAELQATLLGAEKKGTLLSTVIARLTPSSTRTWPAFQGTVEVDSLALGPVKLENLTAEVNFSATSAEITSLDAGLLGGQIHLTGKIENGDKPAYSLAGNFQKVNPAELCGVLKLECTGTSFDGDGKLELAGYAGNELANSAKGTVHFDWKKGGISGRPGAPGESFSPALTRFDQFSGDAEIADGGIVLKENQVQQGARKGTVEASVRFGEPPAVSFGPPKSAAAAKKK
ncbi:MAG: AsmA family protein [Terracidiphilus sp.]